MMKKNLPHFIVLIAALIISYAYFSPLLEGKKIIAHDELTATGGAQELKTYYQQTSDISQWTNSMFGGMPAYTIWGSNNNVFIKAKQVVENIGQHPASLLILIILASYLCLILFGISPWISIFGAISYGFASHYFILLSAGHITKLWSLAYLPPLIAAIYYAFNKSKITGAILTSIFLIFELGSSHPQITYYGFIVILIFGLTYLYTEIKAKNTKQLFTIVGALIFAAILAIGVNSRYLLTTQEYSKFSTRGANELTVDSNKGDSGLAKDYILDYSYDISEAFTAFIPRLKGGGMSEPLGESSKLYKELSQSQGKQQAKQIVNNIPLYWGSQPIVSGPFYFGAITIFLFVLGLFVVKGREKWWLASVVVVSFLLSLGKYFPLLSNLAIDYFPLYNKFRDVKNIVFVQCFAMWLLGMLAIKEIFQDKSLTEKKHLDGLKYSAIIAGGIALIFALIPTLAGSFTGSVDKQLAASGWPADLLELLKSDRISVARMDAFRSLVFVVLAAGTIWAVLKKKLKAQYALGIALILVLADLWPVNKRYLNDDNFVPARQAENPFTPTKADEIILQDKTLDYRVLNIAVSTFNDASTSYFHKSIGGYSGAKMRRYQDMIEHHISPEIQKLGSNLRSIKSQGDIDNALKGLNAINMLNAKYIIYNPGTAPIVNTQAMGNAWFVNNFKLVANADEEIDNINKIDIKSTAVVDKQFGKYITSSNFTKDSLSTITLKSYTPNKLVYQSNTKNNQLAIFSEIYYPKGWVAKIDGKETPYFRANYILRSMIVPAGSHEIVFEFKPKSYSIGSKISLISSILLILAIAGAAFFEYRKRSKAKNNA